MVDAAVAAVAVDSIIILEILDTVAVETNHHPLELVVAVEVPLPLEITETRHLQAVAVVIVDIKVTMNGGLEL